MKSIKVQKLTRENFHKFGSFANFIDPLSEPATGPKDAVLAFFRDMLQVDLGGAVPSFSTCRIMPRPMVITDAEYHNFTSEAAMPLDQDAIFWCAPANASQEFPADDVEAFLVPKGTMIMLRPGVWHHAGIATEDKPLNVMIVLPERAYLNDIYCIPVKEEQQIAIEF